MAKYKKIIWRFDRWKSLDYCSPWRGKKQTRLLKRRTGWRSMRPNDAIKSSQNSPNVAQKVATVVFTLVLMINQQPKQVTRRYFGYFCKKICHQDLSKIAQSGHTGGGVCFIERWNYAALTHLAKLLRVLNIPSHLAAAIRRNQTALTNKNKNVLDN